MINIKTLLPQLQSLTQSLFDDILSRVDREPDLKIGLRDAHSKIEQGGRTTQKFDVWLEDYLDQVAVAWVLSCLFVRFLEDNDLISSNYLAGDGEKRIVAQNEHELYFKEHPHDSDREYLEFVFSEAAKIPVCSEVFAKGKTPLWAVGPSGDMAIQLLGFWNEVDTESGALKRPFKSENLDTRFLGDLYQELSSKARDKYALLQTPEFVETFILDRSLTPAIDEFGYDSIRLLDPACGSGHFLIGAFHRLFRLHSANEKNDIVAAQKALDCVFGVDINPFAIAIARFRLMMAAINVTATKQLGSTSYGWKTHLAVGDSLLFGSRWDTAGNKLDEYQYLDDSWAPDIYVCEEKNEIKEILGQQYHVIVGNPPYITVGEKARNKAYRGRYTSCHREYSLAVPFMERFFQLGFNNKSASAYVGMITANSFMKREFGTKLVEQYLPKVDITHVVDTSGASIPGHSTPTVIIFGRSRKPVGDEIRAVFGIQGEPGTPKDPAQGKVWRSILSLIDTEDEQDRFMSSHDIERVRFATHPWSVGGGGRFELKDRLNSEASQKLKNIASDVGYSVITGEDSFFLLDPDTPDRIGISEVKTLIEGDDVRDWLVAPQLVSFWPREESARKTMPVDALEPYLKFAWPFRTLLRHRKVFSVPVEKKGIRWWDLREVYDQRMQTPTCIAYAEIATHNHFSFRREGWLFKQTAPVIKLKDESSDNYLGVVGLLNSSVAGFWFHEVCHEKGGSGEAWQWRYVYNSTKVENFPLPTSRPLKLSKLIAELSERMTELLPQNFISLETTEDELSVAEQEFLAIRGKLIALQEELDWQVYRDYGLIEDELVCEEKTLPSLKSGERAFEIVMARDIKSGDLQTVWFEKNGGTQRSEMPQQWPDEYKELVSRRTSMIANDRVVRLLERPEYKRRWNQDSFSVQSANAIERLLLQLLENPDLWITEKGVQLKSAFEIASAIASNETFRRLASLYRGRADVDIEALVVGLVAKASVPHLESLVFSKTGLRKLRRWHETWSHQRNEDNEDSIAITAAPDKLTKADYSKGSYYDCRGKLSLPQERFIGFPYCERDGDGSLVLGWAGWDHIQRATAVVAYFDARKREGWAAERLVPLLASLDQLLPWIHQWHPEIDKEYNESAGDSFQTLLNSELQELGLTIEDVRNWTPPKKAKKKATKKKATKKKTAKKKSTKKKTAKS